MNLFGRVAMAMGLFRIRACLQVLVGVWLLWGCASVDQAVRPSGRVWSCDHPADAAVDNEDWLKALKLHQALLEKEPHNCLALYHLGYIRGRLGDRQMEAADYERAVACGYGKDDQLFFNLGMAYAELNQPESAIAAFQRAVDINPASAENHFGWGLAAQSLGRSDQARGAFIQALETDPQHQAARLRLAWILLDEGRLEEGRSHLEILLRKTPGDREALELLRRYEDRRATRYDQ